VILGSGFAAVSLLKGIDFDAYAVTVVSPRNHFLFTPLLPSTTVGTVEFRSIIEPVRKIDRRLEFIQGECTAIDFDKRRIRCRTVDSTLTFERTYDLLVIGVGAWNATFDIPGVREHTFFLKEATDARSIRERIVYCLERADVPGITDEERKKLLTFVIVGGGPTGVEFAAELHDLLEEDLIKTYPDTVGSITIALYEAAKTILNSFDDDLQEYTKRHFRRQGIELHLDSPVSEVGDGCLKLKSGEVIPSGLIVWSTGNSPTGLVSDVKLDKDHGRILTDGFLRVPTHAEIYAVGDCASIVGRSVPQTAQLAMQEGKYLAKALNRTARGKKVDPFRFNDLGMLAYVGDSRALADLPRVHVHWRGALTYLFWRSAYLTRLVSMKNKILVLFDWIKTGLFGRDLSKF
jgi:NADH dehydrogenase FAD-containing subunit